MAVSSGTSLCDPLKCVEEKFLHKLLVTVSTVLMEVCELNQVDVNDAAKVIQRQLQLHEWNKGRFDGIDYNDYAKCCAYLRCYAACHAALVRTVIRNFLQDDSFNDLVLSRECLRVVSVGGGPGNDLLGFLGAIKNMKISLKFLNLIVVDLKIGWGAAFAGLMTATKSTLLKGLSVSHEFVRADLTYDRVPEVGQADIILMVKVLSNLSVTQRIQALENTLMAMKDGDIVLYIDIYSALVISFTFQYHNSFKILST